MRRFYLCLVLSIILRFTLSQAFPVSAQPLLRMERARPGEVVCVLVDADGSYRLEKMVRTKTDIYTGSPGSIQLQRLQELLDDEALVKLSQSDIHNSLIGDTFDVVQFAIWRGQGWQELHFPSPDSRKGVKGSVDPLLHWFQDLQKQKPNATRISDNPTRCMPQRLPDKIVISSAAPSIPMRRPPADYLFRILSSHAYRQDVESTCTVVFKDGHFHQERSTQAYMGRRRDKIAEGNLDAEVLGELNEILNSGDLKNAAASPDAGKDKPLYMQEGTATELTIPREGQIQNLHFLAAQNTIGNPLDIGGASNLGYRLPDQKMLQPLLHWIKENTGKKAHKTERDGVGNDCYPANARAGSGEPVSP